jgi:hypothetical protein
MSLPSFTAKAPDWHTKGMPDSELEKLTADDWTRFGDEVTVYNKAVREYNNAMYKSHSEFLRTAVELYGQHHKVINYLQQNPPTSSKNEIGLHNLTSKYDILRKAAQKREADRAEKELLVKAAVFLTQHGKMAGTDYQPEKAVQAANDVRFNELVAEKVASNSMFDFGGDDYCENCSGWDGEDRRCSCGNRRVSWECEGNFTDMYIYAQAY